MTLKDHRRARAARRQAHRLRDLREIMEALDRWMEEGTSRAAAIRKLYRAASLPAYNVYADLPARLRPGMSPANLARIHREWTASGRDVRSLENRSYRSKS